MAKLGGLFMTRNVRSILDTFVMGDIGEKKIVFFI